MKFAFGMPRLIELKATMQPWELSVSGADQRGWPGWPMIWVTT